MAYLDGSKMSTVWSQCHWTGKSQRHQGPFIAEPYLAQWSLTHPSQMSWLPTRSSATTWWWARCSQKLAPRQAMFSTSLLAHQLLWVCNQTLSGLHSTERPKDTPNELIITKHELRLLLRFKVYVCEWVTDRGPLNLSNEHTHNLILSF